MPACPRCGADNPAASRYCSACGSALGRGGAVAGAERKVVTVVFVDLVGFTSRAEQLDPEDVGRVLMPYHGRVRAELERFGGTVEKFIGDAVVGVFGAPAAHEDDPERAVRAAYAVRSVVAELDAMEPGLDLAVRIGITTGEALVDLAAAPARGEAMVAGDIVNTAARLQQAASPGAILIDAPTARATVDVADRRAVEPLAVKGKAEPVVAFEVLTLHGPATATPRDPRAPLVGRANELGMLFDLAAETRSSGTLRSAWIVGEAGIGKSRLLWELERGLAAADESLRWLRGRSLPYGAGVTYWAFADMVKSQAGILETHGAEMAADRLERCVASAVPGIDERAWVERHLKPLVGLGGEGGDRRDAFAAWRRFLEGVAAGTGLLVLAFEDLQWADEDMLAFVEHLSEWSAESSVLLVATARPEVRARRPDPGGLTIELAPLATEDTISLLGHLLAGTPVRGDVWPRLLARAGGNPLYAEEYARMLVDRPEADELPLPESIQALIAARLDALPAEEKALLQDAAVVGREFWPGALAAVGGMPRELAEDLLGDLDRRGVLRARTTTAVEGEPQFVFSHVLVRDTAYAQIPRAARATKHRLAAEWIATLAPDRAASLAEMTAHHYTSALEYARLARQPDEDLVAGARVALRAAGDHAFGLSAFAAAERFYAESLRLWPEDDADAPALWLRLGTSRFRAEGGGEEELRRAARELLAAGSPERAAEAAVLGAELCFRRGDVAGAFATLEDAAETLERRAPSRQKALVLSTLSRFRAAEWDAPEAIRIGREALAMAEALGHDEIRAHALNNIGTSRVTLGDLGGVEDLERSVEISAALGTVESVRGYLNLGTNLANLGHLERAFAVHAEGRRAAERFGDAIGIRWLAIERLFEDYWRGRWDDAGASADALLAELQGDADYYTELGARIVRAWIRLGRGDTAGARADAARHLELAREVHYPQALFPALAQAARVHAASDAGREAELAADELLREWRASTVETASYWTGDLCFALVELGRAGDFAVAAAAVTHPTAWLDAARAFAEGDTAVAAGRYAAIGSRPDEAYVRLRSPAPASAVEFVRRARAVGYEAGLTRRPTPARDRASS